ncbi:MAG: tetratricopeptide repeat protein [Bacteroidales bacterium]|nr:tetratricopeptide repeat protein [Bacteroidales bacterium]MBN2632424.1 tetratricopeptide repeat protein [Bacteroidales bacterium]
MERAKYSVISLLLLVFLCSALPAGNRTEIYSAYVNDRMDRWKIVIDRMNGISGKSNEQILELVNYQYGYIGYCIGNGKKSEARKYLDLAQKNIDFLESRKYMLSMVNAYNAAFCGFRIGMNVLTAPVNGVRSMEYAKKALELDNENYLGYIQYGNIQFYMPKSFGGSKQEGIKHFLKAREILEKDSSNLKENWNYLSLLVVTGQSYYYLDDYESARKVYENILKIEPEFSYVKDELYPQLLNKMNMVNN